MGEQRSAEKIMEEVRRILETPFWPPSLSAKETYERRHDDDDGSGQGLLTVQFGQDGDAHVSTQGGFHSLRFRTDCGGGHSLRTRIALLILAEAIRLDNEERPQQ